MLEIVASHTPPTGKPTLWKDFRYRRGTEIFGEAESAVYVYQIKSGAVRTFKLLLVLLSQSVAAFAE